MNKVLVSVEGAIYKGDKWLMIVRSQNDEYAPGALSLVGGTVETEIELDDALEMTLHREIEEEIGIEVDEHLEYVENKIFTADTGEKYLNIVFLCKYQDGNPKPKSSEVSEVLWLTTDEVLNHPMTPSWTRQSIRLAEKKLQSL
jgi:8-oxo-dGTP diphosphatase